MIRHWWATQCSFSIECHFLYDCDIKPLYFRESVAGLRTFLLEQTAAGGDRQVLAYVTDLLNKQVGFLLNERYVNIPAQVINPLLSSVCTRSRSLNFQVTVPLLETLVTEMRKATDRNLPFNFSHYIMICKLFKTKSESAQDHQVKHMINNLSKTYFNFHLMLS